MIRITRSHNRKPKDYLNLAIVLRAGIDKVCEHSCEKCQYKPICKSVESAASYALKLYQQTSH